MRAGAYDEYIQIKSKTRTKDTYGEGIETKYTLREGWANIVPLSGYEKRIAGKLTPEQNWKVTMRRDDSITPDDEILWDDLILRFETAERLRRTNETQMFCRETVLTPERDT